LKLENHEGTTMTEPINLMQRFGKRYRIGWDGAYNPKNVPRDKLDPWAMEIPCERGTIYPHGGNDLAVMVDHRPITAKRLAAIPGVELVQDGDHEKTFVFPVELFPQIAKLVKPRRRRQITEANREAARQRMQARWDQKITPEHSRDAPRDV
jgi:hypothetical protein